MKDEIIDIGDIPLTEAIIKANGYTMQQVFRSHRIVDDVWKCKVCNKQLSNKASFIAHLRLHTGEFISDCKKCGKGFTREQHMKTHMRTCGSVKKTRVSKHLFILYRHIKLLNNCKY